MPTHNRSGNEEGTTSDQQPTLVTEPVAVTEHVVVAEPVAVAEPVIVADDGDTVAGTRVVAETQVAVADPDGAVSTTYERVEEQTVVTRERRNWFWPIVALLLLLLTAGLLAWWYFSGKDEKQVPNVIGSSLTTAVNRLQQADFKSSITRSTHAERAGIVFAQDPAPTTKADKGSVVRLSVLEFVPG